MLLFVPIIRCPTCEADLGYFRVGHGPALANRPPQYVTCGRCGECLDKWDGFTPVD